MRFLLMIAAAAAALNLAQTSRAFADDAPTDIAAEQGDLESRGKKPSKKQVKLAEALPEAVVVRIDNETGKVKVAHLDQKKHKRTLSPEVIDESLFQEVELNTPELPSGDQRFLRWYFYFSNSSWYYPTYYYGGYNCYYRPYYNTYSYPYSYYYYSWPYYRW